MDGVGGVNNAVTTLNNVNNNLQKTMQKTSTGSNYPSASYGGSAYAILQRLDSNIAATAQSGQNTQNASAMIRTAEGATGKTLTALTTIKAYIMSAANGTNTDSDRADLQKGVNQLVEQIDDNANVTYNGKHILNGSEENVGIAGLLGYENFNMGDIRAETLGLKDSEGNVTINLSDEKSVQAALSTVDGAIDKVQNINDSLNQSIDGVAIDASLDEATTQGAYLQRLEMQESLYNTMQENEQAAASNIGDADMAKLASEFNNEKNQQQLALFAAKMHNHNLMNIPTLLQA
ncbi:MAG: flagellin [Selenomonadaceae bacterium]|nr:flagellin [Selenomonadaceae bacterium]